MKQFFEIVPCENGNATIVRITSASESRGTKLFQVGDEAKAESFMIFLASMNGAHLDKPFTEVRVPWQFNIVDRFFRFYNAMILSSASMDGSSLDAPGSNSFDEVVSGTKSAVFSDDKSADSVASDEPKQIAVHFDLDDGRIAHGCYNVKTREVVVLAGSCLEVIDESDTSGVLSKCRRWRQKAKVELDATGGLVLVEDFRFNRPSGAIEFVCGRRNGNGWLKWIIDETGEPLDSLRKPEAKQTSRDYSKKFARNFVNAGLHDGDMISFVLDTSIDAMVSLKGNVITETPDGSILEGDLGRMTKWACKMAHVNNKGHRGALELWSVDGVTLKQRIADGAMTIADGDSADIEDGSVASEPHLAVSESCDEACETEQNPIGYEEVDAPNFFKFNANS